MKVPQLHVGAGTSLGPLSIFPVWTSDPGSLGISTGTHAKVAVTELASGAQVSRLTVTNNGPHPALLLEGELLEGGSSTGPAPATSSSARVKPATSTPSASRPAAGKTGKSATGGRHAALR